MSSADGGSWVNEPGTRNSRESCERVQREGVPIEGTAGERYLIEQRGLQHPLWEELRWLPNARVGEGAVVAPLSVDGKLVGYQATHVDGLARKSIVEPSRQTWKLDEAKTPDAIFALPVRGGDSDGIVITDGLEDALSIWMYARPRSRVIGLPGVWALQHLMFPAGTRILVAPDGDPPESMGSKWLQQGIDRLLLQSCAVLCASIPPVRTPKLDANQILLETGVDGLRKWLDEAAPAKLSDDGELRRLARLDILSYALERTAAAKNLGIALKFLDQAVERMRATIAKEDEEAKDDFLDIEETRPWEDEVDGASLLEELVKTIRRHVCMTSAQCRCVALWIVFCHCFDVALSAPKLWISSAERRSGKTRLLELLKLLCPRAIKADAISPAMIPRVIEARRPCLLLDEFDTLIQDNEALRGVINSGFDRGSVIIIGVKVGDNWVPQEFSPWCAQAIAGIGKVPDTIADRSFKIELERKPRDVKVARLRRRDTGPLDDLARKCARWAKDNMPALVDAEPSIPAGLNDRAADAWELCIAIGDLVGADWGNRARATAITISGDVAIADDESIGVMLLSDIRDVFTGLPVRRHAQSGKDIGKQIGSLDLVSRLNDMEHRPWPEIKKGQLMTQPSLARMLQKYHVTPDDLKEGDGKIKLVLKGYKETQFRVVWERYLPPLPTNTYSDPPPEDDVFAATSLLTEDFCASEGENESATSGGSSAPETPGNANVSAGGSGVAGKMSENEDVPLHTSMNGVDEPSISAISAISGDLDETAPTQDGCPNGATDGFVPSSIQKNGLSIASEARRLAGENPSWSIRRIAKHIGQPESRIAKFLPDHKPAPKRSAKPKIDPEVARLVEILSQAGPDGETEIALYNTYSVYGQTLTKAADLGLIKNGGGDRWSAV